MVEFFCAGCDKSLGEFEDTADNREKLWDDHVEECIKEHGGIKYSPERDPPIVKWKMEQLQKRSLEDFGYEVGKTIWNRTEIQRFVRKRKRRKTKSTIGVQKLDDF